MSTPGEPENQGAARTSRFTAWIPAISRASVFVLPILMILLTVLLWWHEHHEDQKDIQQDTVRYCSDFARRIERQVETRFKFLQMLASDCRGFSSQDDVNVLLREAQKVIPASSRISLFDASGQIIFQMPAIADSTQATEQNLDSASWSEIQRTNKPVISTPIPNEKGTWVELMVPINKGTLAHPVFGGVLTSRTDVHEFISRQITDKAKSQFDFRVRANDRVIDQMPDDDSWETAPSETDRIKLANAVWVLNVRTRSSFFEAASERTEWVLWSGFFVSAVVGVAVFQVYRFRTRELTQAQDYTAALEKIHAISTAISGKMAIGEDILQQLALAAMELLKMDMTSIVVLEYPVAAGIPKPGSKPFPRAKVVARVGVEGMRIGDWFTAAQLTTSRIAIEQQRVLTIGDTETSELPVEVLKAFGVRAAMQIPLLIADRVIGILTLGDHSPRTFTQADERLARVWGAQAAVTLANAQLQGHICRQAEARTFLLRELNHRVKNNLAGIVGLLAVEEQNVPEEARPTLARLANRVWVMARTHELFTNGQSAIGIGDLVRQVLGSMGVARPPELEIRLELDQARAMIKTDRAVSLAMVLHELAFNAIVHGLHGRGVLEISAQRLDGGRLEIDVADNGVGAFHVGAVSGNGESPEGSDGSGESIGRKVADRARTGMGLQLVTNLVQRELGGKFSIEPRPTGGTRAIVEFPLTPEELAEESL